MILLEFINSIPLFHEILEWPIHLASREISTLSLSLHKWHLVTAGINLFLIVLSKGSSKWTTIVESSYTYFLF